MKHERIVQAVLLLVSVTIGLAICEAFLRIWDESNPDAPPVGLTTVRNFTRDRLSLMRSSHPAAYDERLGWVPKAGYSSEGTPLKRHVHIDTGGLRASDFTTRTSTRGILVTGDSFAFGDEVSDDETWPAALERALDRPVYNGGVFGYGFDQAVLRAEALAPILHPEIALVELIPEDVERTELSARTGVGKPYFGLEDGRLILRNIPVPPERPSAQDVGVLRSALGYSYFVDYAMRALGLSSWWYVGNWPSTRAHERGKDVSCALMGRLRELEKKESLRSILVVQYAFSDLTDKERKGRELALQMITCATSAGLETIDLYDALRARRGAELRSLFRTHMTREGNALVAREIAKRMR
jgi:hypothetical protein